MYLKFSIPISRSSRNTWWAIIWCLVERNKNVLKETSQKVDGPFSMNLAKPWMQKANNGNQQKTKSQEDKFWLLCSMCCDNKEIKCKILTGSTHFMMPTIAACIFWHCGKTRLRTFAWCHLTTAAGTRFSRFLADCWVIWPDQQEHIIHMYFDGPKIPSLPKTFTSLAKQLLPLLLQCCRGNGIILVAEAEARGCTRTPELERTWLSESVHMVIAHLQTPGCHV